MSGGQLAGAGGGNNTCGGEFVGPIASDGEFGVGAAGNTCYFMVTRGEGGSSGMMTHWGRFLGVQRGRGGGTIGRAATGVFGRNKISVKFDIWPGQSRWGGRDGHWGQVGKNQK